MALWSTVQPLLTEERVMFPDPASVSAAVRAKVLRTEGVMPVVAIEVTEPGRLFIRNICMAFDAYLPKRQGEKPIFSRNI